MVVQGPPGIGKTAFLRRSITEFTGAIVVRASADEGETAMAFSLLDQLRAEAETMAAPATGDDPLAATAFLEQLRVLRLTAPVVVLVDDMQWSDAPSLEALTVALTAMDGHGVLPVLAGRQEGRWCLPGCVGTLDSEHVVRLQLAEFSWSEMRDLFHVLDPPGLTNWSSRRLYEHAGGNPGYATEFLHEFGGELADPAVPALPAPRSVRIKILRRLESCPGDARSLVEAGAVLGDRWDLALAGRMAGLADPLVEATDALAAGLVRQEPDCPSLAFPHPMERAAVYHNIGPARRVALHTRAAELMIDSAEALRHRTAAAPDSDLTLAAALGREATSLTAAGNWMAAPEFHLLAARLSPSGPERHRCLIETFEALLAGGDRAAAEAIADQLEWVELRRNYVRGVLAWYDGRISDAARLLELALGACDPAVERRTCAGATARLAVLRHLAGEQTEALELAAQSLGIDSRSPCATLALLVRMAGVPDLQADGVAVRTNLGVPATEEGSGPFETMVMNLVNRSRVEYHLGRWQEAVAHGEQAVSVATEGGLKLLLAESHAAASFGLAARGEIAPAEEHVNAAQRIADEVGSASAVVHASLAAARLAQAIGDASRQAAACVPLLTLAAADRIASQTGLPWRELLVEALVRQGRLTEAETVLVPLEAETRASVVARARPGAARVRGLLEAARRNGAAAEAGFEASLRDGAALDMPFLQGQSEFAYGAFLRRQGRRRDARAHLQAAEKLFERLAAHPFQERARPSLPGVGWRPFLVPTPRSPG